MQAGGNGKSQSPEKRAVGYWGLRGPRGPRSAWLLLCPGPVCQNQIRFQAENKPGRTFKSREVNIQEVDNNSNQSPYKRRPSYALSGKYITAHKAFRRFIENIRTVQNSSPWQRVHFKKLYICTNNHILCTACHNLIHYSRYCRHQ